MWGEVEGGEFGVGAGGVVFPALAGFAESAVASGDEADDALGGCVEGGGALAGIEDAEAAAGTCADVDEAAAGDEAGLGGFEEGGEGGGGRGHGVVNEFVLFVEEVDALLDGEGVEVGGARVALLGEEVGAVLGRGGSGHWAGRRYANRGASMMCVEWGGVRVVC